MKHRNIQNLLEINISRHLVDNEDFDISPIITRYARQCLLNGGLYQTLLASPTLIKASLAGDSSILEHIIVLLHISNDLFFLGLKFKSVSIDSDLLTGLTGLTGQSLCHPQDGWLTGGDVLLTHGGVLPTILPLHNAVNVGVDCPN